eukprot:ANDGO_01623.mRNA.1 Calcium-transporting ATPase 3
MSDRMDNPELACSYSAEVSDIQRSAQVPHLDSGIHSMSVDRRTEEYGSNFIDLQSGETLWTILMKNFLNPMNAILGFVAVISAVHFDWVEFTVVMFLILFNSVLATYQEYSSEMSMKALRQMTSGTAKVIRDGETSVINIDSVVVGDVVVLDHGAQVPADLRLFLTSQLEIDESILTGESVPVSKHTNRIAEPNLALGDRKNMAFRQTVVTSGRGCGIVTAVGAKTEMGKISARLTSTTSKKTPLQKRVERLMYILLVLAILIALVVFAANDWSFDTPTTLYASATAVALLPEALPLTITVAMALGIRRLAKQKAIVRNMPALEVLGSITDICSDKTGTLTENKMSAVRMKVGFCEPLVLTGTPTSRFAEFFTESCKEVSNSSLSIDIAQGRRSSYNMQNFFNCAALCSSTRVYPVGQSGELKGAGNPTEIALQVMSWKAHCTAQGLEQSGWRKLKEWPFDSEVKRMAVAYMQSSGAGDNHACESSMIFVKGAPERVLQVCVRYFEPEDRGIEDARALSEVQKEALLRSVSRFGSQGLRVVCLAFRQGPCPSDLEVSGISRDEVEKDLIYLGMVGIFDPPRKESQPSVALCQQAGITVRMITGDHVKTATAIGISLGIIPSIDAVEETPSSVVTGPEFDTVSHGVLDSLKDLPRIVARCSPDTKVRMIEALHRRGRIVAVSGDGVNDAPAIKIADVGCAMGSGTDVTKGVADIVITDDNFATIVKAIAEGRRITATISKFLVHFLATNVAEVIVLILGLPLKDSDNRSVFILSPLQILWLNFLTGSPSAIGLCMDPPERSLLQRAPSRDGLFTKEVIADVFVYGTIMGTLSLSSFMLVLFGFGDAELGVDCNESGAGVGCSDVLSARSTAFVSLHLLFLLHAYNVRMARVSIFRMSWFDNRWLYGSVIFGFLTLFPILYIPTVASVFVQAPLEWEWAVVAANLVIFLFFTEAYKWLKNHLVPIAKVAAENLQFSQEVHALPIETVEDVHPDTLTEIANEQLKTKEGDDYATDLEGRVLSFSTWRKSMSRSYLHGVDELENEGPSSVDIVIDDSIA